MSDLFRQLNNLLGINQKRTTPYHPQCNGGQERTWQISKLYYDKNVVPANIDVGYRVFMRVLAGKVGLARKLQKRFSGPWVVK